ncbi:MAG: (d)CMP kinase, partial [Oscillospiraceae bacterium]
MISIAIDGPAGAGKSTISKAVAKQLGYIYVDTGALYRAIGLCALYKKVSTDSPKEILSLLDSLLVDLRFKNGEQHVYVNDN